MKARHIWHESIAIGLIVAGFGLIAGTAYLLYGPFSGETVTYATSTVNRMVSGIDG